MRNKFITDSPYFDSPDHAGAVFRPVFVSWRTFVPSTIMEKICREPLRDDSNAMCLPSGAHVGFSLSPAFDVI
jgi:hypothetical protein